MDLTRPFCLYKPNKNKEGVASQFAFNKPIYENNKEVKRGAIWLDIARQISGDNQEYDRFDWANKLTMKLGPVDISELISVLRGDKKSVGTKARPDSKYSSLFHKSPKQTSMLGFSRADNGTIWIRLSVKKDGENEFTALQHPINDNECVTLLILLTRFTEIIYGL